MQNRRRAIYCFIVFARQAGKISFIKKYQDYTMLPEVQILLTTL
jgi:hypothetical protein